MSNTKQLIEALEQGLKKDGYTLNQRKKVCVTINGISIDFLVYRKSAKVDASSPIYAERLCGNFVKLYKVDMNKNTFDFVKEFWAGQATKEQF